MASITEQEILQAFMTLQTKIDGLGAQVFNSSMLLEYLIERMNIAATQGDISHAHIDLEDFTAYHEARTKELQEQWKQSVQQKVSAGGPTTIGDAPVLDLGE